jgi:4-amino-4-deoxy-L-arabinose transferase-like glycosyltransferase
MTKTERNSAVTSVLDTQSWWRDVLWLTFILALLFGFALGNRALWHPDEGRYVEIPREMAQSGDYVTPRLNGVKYFEKPVLFYWLQAGAIKAFGLSEWAMRLWPAIFGIAGCLLVYVTGRKLYDRRTGLLACAVLATAPLYFMLARVVTLDMPVSVFLTAALFMFLLGTREPPGPTRRNFFWAFYALAALATLTKGLIGIVIPAVVIGAWIVLLWEWRLLKTIYLPSGLLLFLVIAAPWHILASNANPEFAHFYFVHEHFERYLSKVHDRYQPAWFFVPVLIAGFYPWIAFLPQAIGKALPASWVARHQDKESLFLLLWAGLVFAFFSFSDSKLIPYILPAMPPLALLLARHLAQAWDQPASSALRTGVWTLVVVGLVLAAALVFLPNSTPDNPRVAEYTRVFGGYAYAIIGGLLAVAFVPAILSWRRSNPLTTISLMVTSAVFLVIVTLSLPLLDAKRTVKDLALTLKPQLLPADEVLTYRTYYQDLPVYLERRITIVDWKGELKFGASVEDVSGWIIDEAAFWRRWEGPNRVYMLTERDNYDKLRAQGRGTFRLIAQSDANVLVANKENQP